MFQKAINYIRFNTQLKLDDKSIQKEVQQPVAMIMSSPQTIPAVTPQPLMSHPSRPLVQSVCPRKHDGQRNANHQLDTLTSCFRCGKKGNVAKYCRSDVCQKCGETGRNAHQCRHPLNAGRGNPSHSHRGNQNSHKWGNPNAQGENYPRWWNQARTPVKSPLILRQQRQGWLTW